MKKHLFSLIIAAAAIMGTTVSCTKDGPEQPEVIESHVTDSGVDEQVSIASNIGGTTFSYASWIEVDLKTRASGNQKMTAQVNADILTHAQEVKVSDFGLSDPEVTYSYAAGESERQGYYITVTDTVMTCHVNLGAFEYGYNFKYGVPVYDDGISKETMPYHRFENISVGLPVLSDMEKATIRGAEYERKLFQQRISAEFAGKVYIADCCLTLLKKVGGTEITPDEPYQVSTDILDGGLEQDGGSYYAWLKVRQNWSDGSAKELTCHANLCGNDNAVLLPYKVIPNAELTMVSGKIVEGEKVNGGGSNVSDNVAVYTQKYLCEIEYNYFSVREEVLSYEEAYYVDDVLTYPMPGLKLENVTIKNPVIEYIGPRYSEAEGDFICWWLTQEITARLGYYDFTSKVEAQLVVK